MSPVIIYCCKGMEHLIYCIWSVRSLRKLGYETIEIIVNEGWEKEFIQSHLNNISCEIIKADWGNYGIWAFRPFALKRYQIKHSECDVVICDTDILWKENPYPLFNRFKGKPWVHKITSLNPADLNMDIKDIPQSRIGLRTMVNYKNRVGLKLYLNFHLNCGLFMLAKDVFPKVLEDWVGKIQLLTPEEMIMTEALLSLVYAEMGLSPICDHENIKHLGIEHDAVDGPLVSFEIAEPPKGGFTGYQTAQHYYGDQRLLLHKHSMAMGLDYDNLLPLVKKEVFVNKIKGLPKIPRKAINRLRGIGKNKDKRTIYYVVDNKGWVQHRRYRYLTKYLDGYRLKLLTAKRFKLLWNLQFLRRKYILFSSWRITHGLIKENPEIFTDSDFPYFMAAVTSHSNIGGGLEPLNPIPGRDPEEAFRLAVGLLKKFKVVSANSMILYELLSRSLTNLIYCPNGVDVNFFTPRDKKTYNPARIRIGWVGKERGPKNFPLVAEACRRLESLGKFKPKIIKLPKNFRKTPLSFKDMREFYRNIDFYLCASWNEGTPNPALEAGSCGVPIVTTRVGNMRELVKQKKNSFFVEPSVESIVNQFKAISMIDPKDYLKISRNIRDAIVKDWSWDVRIKNFKEAFARLVSCGY